MALPTKTILSLRIKKIVDNNTEIDADKAVIKFSEDMADLILKVLSEAEVNLPVNSIQTLVQVTPATGVGFGINSSTAAIGKLQ